LINSWAAPIIHYLIGTLPTNPEEARTMARQSMKYYIIGDELYRKGFSTPLLKCITKAQAEAFVQEVHGRTCGSHIRERSLASKILKVGYYKSTLAANSINFVKTSRT
jgi:hypothetical protein